MEVVVVKQRRHLEAFWEGVKKRGSKLEITSLNSHFAEFLLWHKILRVQTSGAEAPWCSLKNG